MPPFLARLMENRPLFFGALAGLLGIVVLLILHPWSGGDQTASSRRLTETERTLATVDTPGKAIEIQALMARQGIQLDRVPGDNGRSDIVFEDGATQDDRDKALITMVQSGLMDKNVGLEAFDKGDLTASREEKRIKLIRAQQGELARLIRKIDPIQDATVALAIPEPSVFKSDQKPMSASVQVTLPNGDRLTQDKVRSIINLMVGSIQGLDATHVALSDTNGNTYNSVLEGSTELNDKLEEEDQYMKQKVASQLDRLVGPGHYVVTVSTLLRDTPKETMIQSYDPSHSMVSSKQTFTEKLNSQSGQTGATDTAGGPVSSYIPRDMKSDTGSGSSSRGYLRDGTDVSYANARTQTIETSEPGALEDISIAVTIDKDFSPDMPLENLQQLLARAASPKVMPENVSIAQVDFRKPNIIPASSAPESSENAPQWIFWAFGSGLVIAVIVFLSSMAMNRRGSKQEMAETQQEIAQLKNLAQQQQLQIQAAQQQAQVLMENQQRQVLTSSQSIPGTAPSITAPDQLSQIKQALSELRHSLEAEETDADDHLDQEIKSWIESS